MPSKAQSRRPRARGGLVERVFECSLWKGRLLVLIAVVASLCESIGMFYVATIDTVRHLMNLTRYAAVPEADPEGVRAATITGVVETIDGYLLATVMLIFAYGLYELFISRIDAAESSDRASRVLVIHSLDDLKHRLAQVILLILVVRFFELVLNNATNHWPVIDIVLLSSGIVLVAFALWLSGADKAEGKPLGRALQTKVSDCVNEVESP